MPVLKEPPKYVQRKSGFTQYTQTELMALSDARRKCVRDFTRQERALICKLII